MGAQASAEDVAKDVDLTGKVAIVTGATSGIGVETARVLLMHGARVIIAGRNEEKMSKSKEELQAAVEGEVQIDLVPLELGNQRSCVEAAKKIHEMTDKIDLLINNAGLLREKIIRTDDNFEMMFGANHLGHMTFTLGLMDLVRKSDNADGGRVVVLTSSGHKMPNKAMRLDDLNWEKRPKEFARMYAYQQSKLANVIFASELERRERLLHPESKVHAFSVHPGTVRTNFVRSDSLSDKIMTSVLFMFGDSVGQGTATSMLCAVAPLDQLAIGGYHASVAKAKASKYAFDAEVNKDVWRLSLEMTAPMRQAAKEEFGETFFDDMMVEDEENVKKGEDEAEGAGEGKGKAEAEAEGEGAGEADE